MLFNYLNHIPFVRIVIPFILGIIVSEYINADILFLLLLSILLYTCCLIINIFISYKVQSLWGIFISIHIFLAGILIFKIKEHNINQIVFPEQPVRISGYLEDYPVKKGNSFQSVVHCLNSNTELFNRSKVKILVYFEADSIFKNIEAGDKISFTSVINPIKNKGNPYEFDYKRHMHIKNINYYCYVRKCYFINNHIKVKSILTLSKIFRQHLLTILKEYLHDHENYAIASALFLGDRTELDQETKTIFINSGAQHILAVSGLHVGILYLILSYIFFPLKKIIPRTSVVVIVLLLWFYVFITGCSVSVIRASLMFTFISIKNILNKRTDNINILALAAFIILIINPRELFDISFQLSFLAVFSIIVFYKRIYNWFEPTNFIFNELWKIISLSISVQIGVLPVIIYSFNQFPVYFILTNIFSVYLTFVILMSGFLLFVFSSLPVASYIGLLLSKLLSLLVYILNYINDLPFSVIKNIVIDHFQLLFIFILVFETILYLNFYKSIFLKLAFFSIIIFFLYNSMIKIKDIDKSRIEIYNIKNTTIIDFIYKNESIMLYKGEINNRDQQTITKNHIYRHIKTEKLVKWDTVKYENPFLKYSRNGPIQFCNTKLLWLNHKNQLKKLNHSFKVKNIVISDNLYIYPDSLKIDYKKIIVSSGNSNYTLKKWENSARMGRYNIYMISKEGALMEEIDE